MGEDAVGFSTSWTYANPGESRRSFQRASTFCCARSPVTSLPSSEEATVRWLEATRRDSPGITHTSRQYMFSFRFHQPQEKDARHKHT